MLSSIENLREITRRCHSGEPLDRDLAVWLGQCIEGFLERRHRTLDEAIGLIFPQGGVPWWREEAIRKRDAALRLMAERFYDHLSPCARARQIWTATSRYGASAWRHDRDREQMPAHYLGTIKEHLWSAFTSGAAMPIGERQLRNILAH